MGIAVHQIDLFSEPPRRARRRDPSTSRAAADRVGEFAADHAVRILEALQEHGLMGAEEIGDRIGLDAYAVRKRLPELEREQMVRVVAGQERTTRSGRRERVWGAVA
jgi:predicted ArsR family transcriptional regulator